MVEELSLWLKVLLSGVQNFCDMVGGFRGSPLVFNYYLLSIICNPVGLTIIGGGYRIDPKHIRALVK
jgi:hypothetical protein